MPDGFNNNLALFLPQSGGACGKIDSVFHSCKIAMSKTTPGSGCGLVGEAYSVARWPSFALFESFREPLAMISQVFDKTVAAHSDRVVLVQKDRQISYFELHVYVEWMARYFQSLGVQPGHRLAIFMPNTQECVISLLGLLRLSGVAVPLRTGHNVAEIRTFLAAAKAHAVITIPRYRELMVEVLSSSTESAWPLHKLPLAVFEEDNIATLHGASLPPLREAELTTSNGAAVEEVKKATNGRVHTVAPASAKEQDRAAVLFFEERDEDGAVPKLYTHSDLLSEAEKLVQLSHLSCNDCILSELPFAHTRGFVAGLLVAVTTGAKLVLAEPDDPVSLLQTIADEQVTVYSGDPASFQRLMEATTNGTPVIEALRLCWYDGAPLSPETTNALQ
jgi:non-ribosomal peptide synthetase component E (peptide arylation enzyme)